MLSNDFKDPHYLDKYTLMYFEVSPIINLGSLEFIYKILAINGSYKSSFNYAKARIIEEAKQSPRINLHDEKFKQISDIILCNYPLAQLTPSTFGRDERVVSLNHLYTSSGGTDEIIKCLNELDETYEDQLKKISVRFNEIPNLNLYISCSNETLEIAIKKNPTEMQDLYQMIIQYRNIQQQHENVRKEYLRKKTGSNQLYLDLVGLKNAIFNMPNNDECANKFHTLYLCLLEEIFKYKGNLNDSSYPIVVSHFKFLAEQINTKAINNVETLDEVMNALKRKIEKKKPMSIEVKVAICAVIGAILGFAVGFVATFYAGGVGAIPAAIAGAAGGVALATTGGVIGGLHAKHKLNFFNQGKVSTATKNKAEELVIGLKGKFSLNNVAS